MLFTVIFRDANGASTTEVVEAASRADCFAQMRSRGVAVLSVKEGGVKKSNRFRPTVNGRSKNSSGKLVTGILALLFVALAGVFLWWWQSGPTQKQPKNTSIQKVEKTKQPKTVKTPSSIVNVTRTDASTNSVVVNSLPAKKETSPSTNEMYMGSRIVGRDVRTNRFGEVSEILTTEDGRTHLVQKAEKPVFDNAADQLLAMAVSPSGGVMPPLPLRPGLEAEFRKAIERPIIVHDDDSDSVKEAKRRVIEARIQMKDMLDKGMAFDEVLREHQRLSNENASIRKDAMKTFNELLNSGDVDGAKEYAEKINGTLGQLGIAPITMPDASSRPRRGEGSGDAASENTSAKENH